MTPSTSTSVPPSNPYASLILPVLRQVDAWLQQAVQSALSQSVPCEVIVVLSPETPESNRRILTGLKLRYPSLRLIERPCGMRFAAAMNLGIQASVAPRVGFLLSDDWLDPRAVELSLAKDADIVSTGLQAYKQDGTSRLRHITADWTQAEYNRLPTLAEKAHYLSYFFLYRRSALETVGGLDVTLGDSPGIDDWDLPWTLLEHGASVAIVDQRLYNCRDHEGERLTTRDSGAMLTTFLRVLDKHGVDGELRERLIRQNAPSFGRSLQAVYNSAAPWPVRKLREAYRLTLPVHVRRSIHTHVFQPLQNHLGAAFEQISRVITGLGQSLLQRDPFAAVWDEQSLGHLHLLLQKVLQAAESCDIRLFLSWGTLLGHVREGGLLAWDDDVDLAFFDPGSTYRVRLIDALLAAGLQVHEHAPSGCHTIKVYDPTNPNLTKFSWTWPYVDIYPYTAEYPSNNLSNPTWPMPRELVLPGRSTCFQGFLCWEPEQPLALLDRQYQDWRTSETSSRWNHKSERRKHRIVSRAIVTGDDGKKLGSASQRSQIPQVPDKDFTNHS